MAHARLANEGAADCYLHEMVPYQPRDKKFAPVRPATDPTHAKTLATPFLCQGRRMYCPHDRVRFFADSPVCFPIAAFFPTGGTVQLFSLPNEKWD